MINIRSVSHNDSKFRVTLVLTVQWYTVFYTELPFPQSSRWVPAVLIKIWRQSDEFPIMSQKKSTFQFFLTHHLLSFHALLCSPSYEYPLPSSFPLCVCTARQWIQKPPECGPIVRLYVLHEFIGIHNISISLEGINQAIIICSLKFVMSVLRRCSMFWNRTSIDSINQYYHGNIVRDPLPPQPVEGKGNYAGSIWGRGR